MCVLEDMVRFADESFGGLDLLVDNAHVTTFGDF